MRPLGAPPAKRQKQREARECSAEIGTDGRLGCDCLRGMPEVKADIALCFSRMTMLLDRARTEDAR